MKKDKVLCKTTLLCHIHCDEVNLLEKKIAYMKNIYFFTVKLTETAPKTDPQKSILFASKLPLLALHFPQHTKPETTFTLNC